MALHLAGLGIGDQPNPPIEVSSRVNKYDEIFYEPYTSPTLYTIDDIREAIGRDVELIQRKALEDESSETIRLAKEKDVLILVPGDPLIATTHKALIHEAREMGVETKVYHNSSIYTAAIGEAGLDIYRFGASGTIVRGGYDRNTRNYRILLENFERGLHTFFFLEYSYDEGYMMNGYEALQILQQDDEAREVLNRIDTYLIIARWVGTSKQEIIVMNRPILKDELRLRGATVLLVASKPHFSEKYYLMGLMRRG